MIFLPAFIWIYVCLCVWLLSSLSGLYCSSVCLSLSVFMRLFMSVSICLTGLVWSRLSSLLSVCLFVSLFVQCLPVLMSSCTFLSTYFFVCIVCLVCPSICLLVCLAGWFILSDCLTLCLFMCLPLFMSVPSSLFVYCPGSYSSCLLHCLSVFLFVFLFSFKLISFSVINSAYR